MNTLRSTGVVGPYGLYTMCTESRYRGQLVCAVADDEYCKSESGR